MTVSGNNITMNGITITYSGDNYSRNMTVNTGTLTRSGSTGTWTGEANPVVFTGGTYSSWGTTYYNRVTQLVVDYMDN